MQHKVTGQHIEAGFKGLYRYAKTVWEETHDYNEVARRITHGLLHLRGQLHRAAQAKQAHDHHAHDSGVPDDGRDPAGVRAGQPDSTPECLHLEGQEGTGDNSPASPEELV